MINLFYVLSLNCTNILVLGIILTPALYILLKSISIILKSFTKIFSCIISFIIILNVSKLIYLFLIRLIFSSKIKPSEQNYLFFLILLYARFKNVKPETKEAGIINIAKGIAKILPMIPPIIIPVPNNVFLRHRF